MIEICQGLWKLVHHCQKAIYVWDEIWLFFCGIRWGSVVFYKPTKKLKERRVRLNLRHEKCIFLLKWKYKNLHLCVCVYIHKFFLCCLLLHFSTDFLLIFPVKYRNSCHCFDFLLNKTSERVEHNYWLCTTRSEDLFNRNSKQWREFLYIITGLKILKITLTYKNVHL